MQWFLGGVPKFQDQPFDSPLFFWGKSQFPSLKGCAYSQPIIFPIHMNDKLFHCFIHICAISSSNVDAKKVFGLVYYYLGPWTMF